ncbi:MAG TPA: GAF domain-containing protein, partial [Chloroflexota bacterium]
MSDSAVRQSQTPTRNPLSVRQAILIETVGAIGAAADLEGALRALIGGMATLTGADSGGVRLLLDPSQPLSPARLLFWRGGDDYTWVQLATVPGSNAARVVATGRGEYTRDLMADVARGEQAARIAHDRDQLRSSLIVPLRAAGRIIGTVHADSRRPNAFRPQQLGPLQMLADYAAGTIEQARLREQAAERLRHLEVAARVSAAVNAAGDLDSMLQRVLEEAALLVGAGRGTVALVDADRQFVRGRVGYRQPPGLIEASVRRLHTLPHPDEDIYSLAVRTGEQTLVEDDHPALHQATKTQFALHAWHRVLTPIRHAGEVIGVINLAWHHDPRPSEDNLAMLRLFAEQAGGACARAWLAEAQAAAHRRQQELAEGIAKTLAEVGAALEPETALEALVRGAVALLRGDAGVGRLFDPQTGECTLLLRLRPEGVMDRVREGHRLDPGTVGAALQAGGPAAIVEDFTAFDPSRYAYAEVMRSQGLRSAVNVPIDASGQRIGSVHVNHRHPGFFGPTDLVVASALAAQAGTVIERVRLVAAERSQLQARVEAEARFHALVDAAPDAVITADSQGRMIVVNRRVEELFGYPQEVVLGQPIAMLMPERFRAAHMADIERVHTTGVVQHTGQVLASRGLRQDGSEFPLELSLSSWQMAGRVFIGGIIRDVTARKEAEEALVQRYREAEQARGEARAILDATEEAMLLVAADGRVLSANRHLAALFGMRAKDLIGLHAANLETHLARIFTSPGNAGRLIAYLAGGDLAVLWDLRQRWPVERDLALTCRPVTATNGSQLGRLFAFRDVTQERALIRLKDEFVAHVSHELRTPLTSIKGYADLLLAGDVGDLSREQREFLEIIQRNADREVALVNDLLDLSSLGAGKLDLTLVPFDLCRLLAGVVVSFRPQLAAKQQALTTELPASLPTVLGDTNRLIQVFTN